MMGKSVGYYFSFTQSRDTAWGTLMQTVHSPAPPSMTAVSQQEIESDRRVEADG